MSWDNFNKYVGVQGILALLLTLSMVAWVSFQMTVPSEAWALLGASWGFYFAKNGTHIAASHIAASVNSIKNGK